MKVYYCFCAAILLLLSPQVFQGQELEDNTSARSIIESYFTLLELQRVPTGLLLDYATELVSLNHFNGTLTDTNYVNSSSLEYILRTIRSSSVLSSKPFPPVSSIYEEMDTSITQNIIPVCAIAYKYNYIPPTAVNEGVLQLVNNKPKDVYLNEEWQNPYEEAIVIAFAPYARYIPNVSITFSFSNRFFTNLGVNSVFFDAGNGGGYQDITTTHQVSVNYSSIGEKELKLKLVMNSGENLYSHSRITVCNDLDIVTKSGTTGNDIAPDLTNVFTQSIGLRTIKAYVSVKYANGNDCLRKPLIIAEGFDPHEFCNDNHNNAYYEDKGFTTLTSYLDYSFIHSRLSRDYDVVYIDWDDCDVSIEDNALLLIQIINWVNNTKTGNEKSILWAQSMGGLISRSALVSMENSGINHQVSTFVSHDVPYLGVNVPPGLLYLANYLLYNLKIENIPVSPAFSIFEYVRIAKRYLKGNSIKQMLINYIDENSVINHSDYNNMIQVLGSDGFPQSTRNIAISNGGWGLVPSSDYLFNLTGEAKINPKDVFSCTFYLSGIPLLYTHINFQELSGFRQLYLSAKTYPYFYNNSNAMEFLLTAKKCFGWNLASTINVEIDRKTKQNPSGIPLDLANGSYYDISPFLESIDSINPPNGILGQLGLSYDSNYNNSFLFVPTASSFCVGKGDRALTASEYQSSTFNDEDIPFEYYRLSSDNYHTSADSTDYNWVYLHLRRILSGPVCPTNANRTYTMTYWDYPVTWSTNNSSVATIDSNGILTKVSDGAVTVKAAINVDTDTLYYEKRVMTGLPAYSLHSLRMEGTNNYDIDANPPASILPIPTGATPIGQWGFKNEGSTTIVWQEPSNILHTSFSLISLGRHVYFKAFNDVFTSPVSSIYCRVYPIYHDPFLDPLFVGGDGNFYTGGDDPEQIETRTASGILSVTYNFMEGVSVSYDHIPSVSELLSDLLEYDTFTEELHKMKCWGDAPFAIFPVNIYFWDGENSIQDEALMKFIFNEELGKQ